MSRITAYAALPSVQMDDVLPVVDVHDLTMALSGTTKKITVSSLFGSASFSADPAGVFPCDAAVQAAMNSVPASGGSVLFPPGVYLYNQGVTAARPGIYLQALIPGTVVFKYTGNADCVRMYTPNSYSPGSVFGGGVIGGIIGDLTSAGPNASFVHAGDIYKLRWDFSVRGQGNPKAVWFDNQYWWAEQMAGPIWMEQCGITFDRSANFTGSSTGSFDRSLLDLTFDNKGKSNLVTFQNGAIMIGQRLLVAGNTDYGAAQYYVFTFTGPGSFAFTATNAAPCVFTAAGSYYSNGDLVFLSGGGLPGGFTAGQAYFVVNVAGPVFQLAAAAGGAPIASSSSGSGTVQAGSYSRIGAGPGSGGGGLILSDVECNGTSGIQPGTVNFGSQGNNGIFGATGSMNFAGAAPFAPAPVFLSSFEFDGPVWGDSHLQRSDGIGTQAYQFGALATSGTIFTKHLSKIKVSPAGNVSDIRLQGFQTDDDRVVRVINKSAFTITFAPPSTSKVADGTSDVIQPNAGATYQWDNNDSLWYRVGS